MNKRNQELISELVRIIYEHEIDTVDSRAALARCATIPGVEMGDAGLTDDEYIILRQANSHCLGA